MSDNFKDRLLDQLDYAGVTYSDVAQALGIKSRQMFKYKMDHDSFTRVELLKLRDYLGLGEADFLKLLGEIKNEIHN